MKLPYSTHLRLKFVSPFLTFFPKSPTIHTTISTTASATISTTITRRRKRKIVVIMGPTGAGKSRLSIDLATRFFDHFEIINSDKMQVYTGLDITTNKITFEERLGVPHHLLGVIDPTKSAFTCSNFRNVASDIISDVMSRRRLPVVVGGSNSFIHSLVTTRFDPYFNFFNRPDSEPGLDPGLGVNPDPDPDLFRYDCCFIWVDVGLPVLNRYLSNRVDEMLDSGMYEELVDFYRSGGYKTVNRAGLGQAIGVPEFEGYLTEFENLRRRKSGNGTDSEEDVTGRMEAYGEVVRRIKDNTCHLAKRQVGKIRRLREAGWELKRIDATAAFTAGCGGGRVAEVWEKEVVQPSVEIVKRFLDE